MSFVVAVTDYVFPSLEPEQRELEPLGVELRPRQCRSEDEIIALAQEADAVLNCYAKMTSRLIESLKRCRIIARYGIGANAAGQPLRQAPNFILTPQLAFYSRESVIELQTKAAEEVARALKGEPPRSPVNPEVLRS